MDGQCGIGNMLLTPMTRTMGLPAIGVSDWVEWKMVERVQCPMGKDCGNDMKQPTYF